MRTVNVFCLMLCILSFMVCPGASSNNNWGKGLISGSTLAIEVESITGDVPELPGYLEEKDPILMSNSQDAQSWIDIGLIQIKRNNYHEAEEAFLHAISVDPHIVQAWDGYLLSLSCLGDFDKLLHEAKRGAEEVSSNWPEGYYYQGIAHSNIGNYGESVSAFETALDLRPDYYEAQINLGNDLNNLGRYSEALSTFETILRQKPDSAYAWNGIGNSFSFLGRYDEALSAFDTAIIKDPSHDVALLNKGELLAELERYSEAISVFKELTRIQPDFSGGWAELGAALNNRGEYEEAISASEKAISLDPDQSHPWYVKAYALTKLEEFEKAIPAYEMAIQRSPEDGNYWAMKGYCLERMGDKNEAVKAYDKAVSLGDPYAVKAKQNLLRSKMHDS